MYFKGRRVYNNSFKDDLLLVESKASRNTSIEEDKLKPGTKYTIHVTAFTERGEGAPSDTVIVSTLAKGNSQHHRSRPDWFKKFRLLAYSELVCRHSTEIIRTEKSKKEHNRIKNPSWKEENSWLFTRVASDLISGKPRTNPASEHSRIRTRGRQIASSTH